MKSVSNCIVCGEPLSGKQRSFCSIECKNDHYLSYDALKRRALERKLRLIAANGGACVRCGYRSNLDALSFYDQKGETLHVDTNILANSNYERLKKKLADAQVLCRNCVEELNSTFVSSRPSTASGEISQETLRDSSAAVGMTIKKFTKNLAFCGIKSGQTLILGVSGGVDSVTMLDLFAKSDLKLNLLVAHMNHGMRKDATKDESLVKLLASNHNLLYRHSHILENVRMLSVNTEEYLRNKRREFLLEVAGEIRADYIALAHNADDQAETFIMNVVRGSGPAGLGAMSIRDGLIIRPLLNIPRSEIEAYARQYKLVWNEDATNKDISYNRNYVRHRILPLLSRLNPEYLGGIGRTTGLQRQIDAHFKEEAYRIMQNPSAEHFRRLDKPLLYEVLGLLYEETKGDRQNLSLAHLSDIEKLIQTSDGTKTLDLPGNVVVKRSYDKLDFYAKKEHNTPPTPSTKKLKIGGQYFGSWKVTVSPWHPEPSEGSRTRILDSSDQPQNDEIFVDAGMLPHLVLRTRRPGDKIASLGTKGTKKLQDLFVDAKIDRVKRTLWPILEDSRAKQVIWVPGLAKAKTILKTKKLLKIKIVEVGHETTEKK